MDDENVKKWRAAIEDDMAYGYGRPTEGQAALESLCNALATSDEQLQTTHRQVAEIAGVLDSEVTPDAWGCHEAAQKRMRRLAMLQREAVAVVEERRGWQSRIATLEHNEARLKEAEQATRREGVAALEQVRATLAATERQRDEARAEADGLRAQVVSEQARVETYQHRLETAERQRDEEERRGRGWMIRAEDAEAEVEILRKRVVELTQERDEALARTADAKRRADNADRRAAYAKADGDIFRLQVDAIESIASNVVQRGEGEAVEALAHRILSVLTCAPIETPPEGAPTYIERSVRHIANVPVCGRARYAERTGGPDLRLTKPCAHPPNHQGKHSWEKP